MCFCLNIQRLPLTTLTTTRFPYSTLFRSIPPHYNSLNGKLIVHGTNRNECLMRLRRSLEEYAIGGLETTIRLHLALINEPDAAGSWSDRKSTRLNSSH